MSVNLLQMATGALSGDFSSALSGFLGEGPSTASSGLAAALPALLGGLVNKGSSLNGASSLLSLLEGPSVNAGAMSQLGSLFGNGGAGANSMIGLGTSLLGSLFGDKVGGIASALGSVAGLKGSSATSLLSLAAPLLLGMLKSHVGQNKLGATGLMDLLKGQAAHLSGAVDPRMASAMGFPSVAGLLGMGSSAASTVTKAAGAGVGAATAAAASGGSSLMRWLPWLVGAAVLLWALSSMRGCGTEKVVVAPAAPAAPVAAVPAPAPTVEAPKAAATVAAPPAARVHFEVGKFDPPADAAKELDAMVVYARANANAKLSISGFHDKTGDAAKNEELAKSRGMAIKNVLISAGVPEDRIMMQKPQVTTGGADDKEARRVEVSVAQ